MFETIMGSVINGAPSFEKLLLCTVCSLILGLGTARAYMFKNAHSKSLAETLVIMPAIVQIIIMLVNGNIGAGVAVAGAFSLVRFRSVAGSARDIGFLFFAMAVGFVTGMGYLFYAFVFLLLIGGAAALLTQINFGGAKAPNHVLRITLPENINFNGLFDDVFEKYACSAELDKIRTVNMGSLYEITYNINLKADAEQKALLDDLRCRNGNLNILLCRERQNTEEL